MTVPADDPESGLYRGAAGGPGALPRRWSKAWFEWRDKPEFAGYVGADE